MRSLKAFFKHVIDSNQHDGARGSTRRHFKWFSYETDLLCNSKPPQDINRNLKIHSSFIGKNRAI